MKREPVGRMEARPLSEAKNDIGPRKMSNPAYVASEVWTAFKIKPLSTYRLRQLLTVGSPIFNDLDRTQQVLTARHMLTRVSRRPADYGIPFSAVQDEGLSEVYARFTAQNLPGEDEALKAVGGSIPVAVSVLHLRKQGREWRVHELIEENDKRMTDLDPDGD